MRPRGSVGEIRRAMQGAAHALAVESEHQAAHWRAIAAKAQVGFGAARTTIKDMVRAGDLARVGETHVAGSRRPMALYAPRELAPARAVDPSKALVSTMCTWARG